MYWQVSDLQDLVMWFLASLRIVEGKKLNVFFIAGNNLLYLNILVSEWKASLSVWSYRHHDLEGGSKDSVI